MIRALLQLLTSKVSWSKTRAGRGRSGAVLGEPPAGHRTKWEASEATGKPRLGPWGIYGEAIGNPKFFIGTDPKDSEFLQAADEFAAAHEELLRELAKR
jgi:hypothetical protein